MMLEAIAITLAVLLLPGFMLLGSAWVLHKKWRATRLRSVK